jgi:membrane-associated phospholipid phosphatase
MRRAWPVGHISGIVGGILLLVALVWLWHWVRHHQTALLGGGARTLALRRRALPLVRFMQARLSPAGYLGLHLTLGVLILLGASWLFGVLVEDMLTDAPLTVLDREVAQWLHAHAIPPVTTTMLAISTLGSAFMVTALALGTALLLVWRRHWYRLLALGLAVPGGVLLNVLLKSAFQRGRPIFDDPLLVLTTSSFPSGHAMAATVLYGALAASTVWHLRPWRSRMLVGVVAGVLIVLVGFSRLYLGVHYLSDVLGGMAAGVAWLAMCLTGVETVRRRRLARQTALSPPPDGRGREQGWEP